MKRFWPYLMVFCSLAGGVQAGSGVGVLSSNPLSPLPLCAVGKAVFDPQRDTIIDPARSLDAFYSELAALKAAPLDDGTQVVSVLHLGDSHIQAGFLTGNVMRHFHRDFGNAGRGLITPLKMAKTNEPSDYVIRSDKPWSSSRLVQSSRPLPVGVGGIAIGTREGQYSLTVGALKKDSTENYAFNRIRILKYPGAPELTVKDDDMIPFASYVKDENPYVSAAVLPRSVSELTLFGRAPANQRDSSIYYGFVLENGRNGVLYHSVGINGAQFLHWTRVSDWRRQIQTLSPDLVVLSMGTNEALMGKSFSSDRFAAQIDSVVTRLRAANPEAVFLLTTPPDSYQRQLVNRRYVYKPNPQVGRVSAVIREYARRNNLACWDLYAIAGGDGSCAMWQKEALFSRDRLHFTAEGYNVLGNYLYMALLKGYNQYVRDHYGKPAPDPDL